MLSAACSGNRVKPDRETFTNGKLPLMIQQEKE